jgi:hypothetical protein
MPPVVIASRRPCDAVLAKTTETIPPTRRAPREGRGGERGENAKERECGLRCSSGCP